MQTPTRVRLSARSDVQDEPTPLAHALGAATQAAERGERRIFDLTASNPTRVGLPQDAYGAVERWAARQGRELWSTYTPETLGLPVAREAIARSWPGTGSRAPVDPEKLLLVASSSEAYAYVFTLLCDAGDEVLVPRPSYPLLDHLGRYAGVGLVPYSLDYDGAWHVDFASLERAIGARTRAIVIVNPNNPTGSYLKQSELSRLAALGLPLVVDEVFARFELSPDPERVTSAHGASDALTFCIDGLSKSAGLPQLKLSWVAVSGPEPLASEAHRRLSWLADTYLSVSTPAQRALPAILQASTEFRRPLLERLRGNYAVLCRELGDCAATVLKVEGGWYAPVQLPALASEDDWVLALLEREGVMVHPGYFYDFERGPFVVLSLLPEPSVFAAGVAGLRRVVDRLS